MSNYVPGGSHYPKRKRLMKKILRPWVDGGWKCYRWYLESHAGTGGWDGSKWQPNGPYNRSHRSASRRAPRPILAERKIKVIAALERHAHHDPKIHCDGCFYIGIMKEQDCDMTILPAWVAIKVFR
jgi:hypothetical protein